MTGYVTLFFGLKTEYLVDFQSVPSLVLRQHTSLTMSIRFRFATAIAFALSFSYSSLGKEKLRMSWKAGRARFSRKGQTNLFS